MAAPRWKRAAGSLLGLAKLNSILAGQRLAVALRDLGSDELLQTRNAAGRYTLLDSAALNVQHASLLITISMAGMVAAEFLFLRGCGLLPTHPLASIADLRDHVHAHRGVGLALARLQSARAYGQEALQALEVASGHLQAAQFMATLLPQAAGLHAVMEGQVHAANNQINQHQVVGGMLNMSLLVSCAAEPALRIQSG